MGVGFTDDLGALGLALLQVSMYIDDEVKAKAKAKLADWLVKGWIRLRLMGSCDWSSLKMATLPAQ